MADDATDPDPTVDAGETDAVDPTPEAEKVGGVAAKKPAETAAKKSSAAKKKVSGTGANKPGAPVVKKRVTSKRVTPKGGPIKGGPIKAGATPGSTPAHAHAPNGDDAGYSARYTPPTAKYADGPSPTWVPVLMFALLGLGGLLIIANYARAFGEPENWRLLVGLGGILGGIITATNYR